MADQERLPAKVDEEVLFVQAFDQESQNAFEVFDENAPVYISPIRCLQDNSREIKAKEAGYEAGGFVWNSQYLPTGIRCVVLAVRARGTRYDNNQVAENIWNQRDPKFVDWMKSKDKQLTAGPEFLLWLPDQDGFARLHMFKSNLNCVNDFRKPGKALKMNSKFVRHKGNEWYSTRAQVLPDESPENWNKPTADLARRVAEQFRNPSDKEDVGSSSGDAPEKPAPSGGKVR